LRILCLDAQANAVDWLLRCQAAGHAVKWYVPPKPRLDPIGRGLIERVPEWRPWVQWADLIFLTDNTLWMRDMDMLRRHQSTPFVVGATEEVADWELDRNKGMAMFRQKGIAVPKSVDFHDYDAAIAFVKKQDKAFVSKPSGDADKALSYVAKTPEDLVYMLQRWKKHNKRRDFILQEKIDGDEMAVGGWFGLAGFAPGWCENFEFKKLCDGDRGPNCFTPDAEVLTRAGWKRWPDVTLRDEICTLKNGQIQYDFPSQIVHGWFGGALVGWHSNAVDILVTPGHQMYVQDDHYRRDFWFEDAADTAQKTRAILRGAGTWVGEDSECLRKWAALLGAYIADGHCRKRSIVFGNCPPHKQAIFRHIAEEAGYSAHLYGKDLYINSLELANTFKPLGSAAEKYVPQYIKDASSAVINEFLSGYAAGDGSRRSNNLILTTVSRRLADDLQELCLKAGMYCSISTRDRRDESHEIAGVLCVNRLVSYDLNVNKQKLKAELRPNIAYRKAYHGPVYCCTVPSHVIYVRRNGKACWIGQTGEQGTVLRYVSKSKLADAVLAPFAPALRRSGYVGYIDVNCIIDAAGTPWPLEFTCRPGWPTFNIQQALHEGDPAEWLMDLATGHAPSIFKKDTIAAGVVLSIPDYPFNKLAVDLVTGIPIYGIQPSMRDSIHPCEVALGVAPQKIKGQILEAPIWTTAGTYILVGSGTGATVEEARRHAYQILDRLSLPNSPMYRTDIGHRLRWQLPRLQDHGYALGMSYAATP
jgi:phosphoribosylamine-glycine ligase